LDWSRPRGFGIRKGRTKYNKGRLIKCWIQCDKAEEPKEHETERDAGSKGRAYTFGGTASFYVSDGKWHLLFYEPRHVRKDGKRSHGLSLHLSAHPCHRKRTPQQLAQIQSMSDVRIAPKFIYASLRQADKETLVSAEDIRNERRKYRRAKLDGLTSIQALISVLKDGQNGWEFNYKVDEKNYLMALFFAYEDQIRLARAYPEVLLINTTYKTNWYNMPLVHLIAVMPSYRRASVTSGSNLSIGFYFISGKNAISYQ
jgi:hypothetical protein